MHRFPILRLRGTFSNGYYPKLKVFFHVVEFLSNGAVRVDYVRSDENLADPLTKGLAREKVWKTSKGMGLKPLEG